uniref:Mannosyl-oligosaccharide glucosidase n=1 Tax=Enchytraeus japonensis TaxID=228735 RepID=Q1MX36_9ANNE|nr:hypothetical protein similar to glucosidase 1 [Enchytraeus japonensis]
MAKKKVPREKNHSGGTTRRTSESSSNNHADSKRQIRIKLNEKRKRQEPGSKVLVFAVGIASITVVLVGVGVYFLYQALQRDLVRAPLRIQKMVEPNATLASVDPARFWGSYRPGVYFGMKTRSPYSPVMGMMWMNQFQTSPDRPLSIRHWCSQSDGLARYGWLAHDGFNFGIHEAVDSHYSIVSDFVKRPNVGKHGGDWTARIKVSHEASRKPGDPAPSVRMSVLVYMALDPEGRVSGEKLSPSLTGKDRLKRIRGYSPHLGNFHLSIDSTTDSVTYNHLITYASSLDQLHDIVQRALQTRPLGGKASRGGEEGFYLALPGVKMPSGMPQTAANFLVSQITFTTPLEVEIRYESEDSGRAESLTGAAYEQELVRHVNEFNKRFNDKFSLSKKDYNDDYIKFAKATLSNMLGGIGYFYGQSLVTSVEAEGEKLSYWAAPLYTGVPSRSFFPRGFLWDEGFHNLLIGTWDRRLTLDIVGHWFDLVNVEGWVPREQILGAEARARVPEEFILQHSKNANPPTFFLPLKKIVDDVRADPKDKEGLEFLRKLFPRLKYWYSYYENTQSGKLNSTYRWRGRNATNIYELNPKTLTSGLDDYPRASHPTDDERHVDLRCWMALSSGVMADLAEILNVSSHSYAATHAALMDNERLNKLHWSERTRRYADFGLHTDAVRLERPEVRLAPGQRPPSNPPQKIRVVRGEPSPQLIDNSYGYVNLFPLLLRVLDPDSPHLEQTIQDMRVLLWTRFGLRSLEKKAPMYGKHNTEHDPAYWRGAIWINMNYLAVSALKHYSTEAGPYKDLAAAAYKELRQNLVRNIYDQYVTTGYVWEQYDDESGRGKGSHPFTGWSALVVSIMAEQY